MKSIKSEMDRVEKRPQQLVSRGFSPVSTKHLSDLQAVLPILSYPFCSQPSPCSFFISSFSSPAELQSRPTLRS